MSLLIKNGLVVRGSAIDRTWDRVDILIQRDTITAVGNDVAPPASDVDIIDASDQIVMPGLINAHMHSNESFEQGAYDNLPLDLWLLESYSPFGFPLRGEREHYLRTMTCAIRSIRSGVTTVQDDIVYPPSTDDTVDAAMRAYRDAGLRAWVTVDMWDRPFMESLPFVNEIIPADMQKELNALPGLTVDEFVGLFERHAKNWHEHDGRLRVLLAPCGPQRCSLDLLREIGRLSDAYDVPIHSHTLETRLQAVQAELEHGQSWIAFLDDLGLLGPRTTLVHGIWLSDSDIARLAERECTIVHNPLSNLKLGSGVCPVRRLLDAGVNVALGTDGMTTSDTADLVEAIRVASLIHKIDGPDYTSWVGAEEVFDMATKGGARSGLMQDSLGEIAPGMRADIILLDANDWGFTPLTNPVQQLAFSANAGAVRTSIVNGKVVMRDRDILTIDEAALKAEIQEAAERFWRDDVPAMRAGAARLKPYLEKMYWQAQEHEIDFAPHPRRQPPVAAAKMASGG